MSDRKIMYIHTVDGWPARFVPGKGLVRAYMHEHTPIPLVASSQQIRRERDESIRLRSGDLPSYGHVRVEIPADVR